MIDQHKSLNPYEVTLLFHYLISPTLSPTARSSVHAAAVTKFIGMKVLEEITWNVVLSYKLTELGKKWVTLMLKTPAPTEV